VPIDVVAGDYPNRAALQGRTGPAGPVVQLPADLGLTLSAVTDELRAKHKIAPRLTGPVVTNVVQNSVSWNRGLRTGDVIVMVQGDIVKTPADVQSRIAAARAAGQYFIRMMLDGPDGSRWVTALVATTL